MITAGHFQTQLGQGDRIQPDHGEYQDQDNYLAMQDSPKEAVGGWDDNDRITAYKDGRTPEKLK